MTILKIQIIQKAQNLQRARYVTPSPFEVFYWDFSQGKKKKKKTKRFCKVPAAESEQALQVTSVTLTPAR